MRGATTGGGGMHLGLLCRPKVLRSEHNLRVNHAFISNKKEYRYY